VGAVGCKVRKKAQEDFLPYDPDCIPLMGILPFSEEIATADLESRPPALHDPAIFHAIETIAAALEREIL